MSENATFVKSSVTISPDLLKKCTFLNIFATGFDVRTWASQDKKIPQNIKYTAGIMC